MQLPSGSSCSSACAAQRGVSPLTSAGSVFLFVWFFVFNPRPLCNHMFFCFCLFLVTSCFTLKVSVLHPAFVSFLPSCPALFGCTCVCERFQLFNIHFTFWFLLLHLKRVFMSLMFVVDVILNRFFVLFSYIFSILVTFHSFWRTLNFSNLHKGAVQIKFDWLPARRFMCSRVTRLLGSFFVVLLAACLRLIRAFLRFHCGCISFIRVNMDSYF